LPDVTTTLLHRRVASTRSISASSASINSGREDVHRRPGMSIVATSTPPASSAVWISVST
jgi:hypothetical protein